MRPSIVWLALLLVAPRITLAAPLADEAAQFLSQYIRIDTSNPPGNEINAARFLAERFRAAGLEAEVFESEPGRGSVLARLRGTGKQRPLVLLNHLDVVPAEHEQWQHDPFAGDIADGYVHGRGALDCKGIAVTQALTLIELARAGTRFERDILFLGTADEETGGKLGAGWFVKHHFDKLGNPEFVLNEGGHIRNERGQRFFEVAVSEKTPYWLRLTATGPGGHGSTPPQTTAVARLLAALERIRTYESPVRVTDPVQQYFAALASSESEPRASRYRDLRRSLADSEFRHEFLSDPRHAALVRNTITPTVLSGSSKTNIIPTVASAEIDCRLLPGEDPAAFEAEMKRVIADADIELEVLLQFAPSASPIDNALFDAIERVAAREGVLVLPTMLRGFTDSHYFRNAGVISYGFVPFDLTPTDAARMHGHDERMSIASLGDGIRRLQAVLVELDRGTNE